MNLKASAVFTKGRALLDEYSLQGEFSDAILTPHLNMAIEAFELKVLMNPNVQRMKTFVIIQGVPAGTTDLKDYFAAGKPLELLNTLISLRERQAGQDDPSFLPMRSVNDLPSVTQTGYNGQYIWNGSTIMMAGATQALDFRVWGEFKFQEIKNGESPIIPNTGLILSHGMAFSAGGSRGKAAAQKLEQLFNWYMSQFMNIAVMEMQGEPIRQQAFGTGLAINYW